MVVRTYLIFRVYQFQRDVRFIKRILWFTVPTTYLGTSNHTYHIDGHIILKHESLSTTSCVFESILLAENRRTSKGAAIRNDSFGIF